MVFSLRLFFVLLLGISLPTTKAFSQQPKTKVTLGIKPDYMYTFKGEGVRVNGLVEGHSAEKAGIREGDIIVAFDDKKIKDIFAYRDQLSQYGPGDRVKVTVNRDGQIFNVPIQFK